MWSPDLLIVCVFGAVGGALFGYDLGLIGGVLIAINGTAGDDRAYPGDAMPLDEVTQELVVGGCKVGAVLGAVLSIWLLRCGHHTCFVLAGLAYVVGPVVMAAAQVGPRPPSPP